MGSMFSSPQFSKEQMEAALTKAKQIVSSNPVVVFSKTYCGYCTRVKKLLSQLGATFKVIELDRESDGDEVQAALLEWTKQRTVPNVFIGGEHVGGCDSVLEKHQQGKLLPMLKDAAAIPNNPAKV
ncbi:glutaredoxin [Solanum lycopersicum]|uniref:Glutaredoxin domain-containing protein n=2 Tax=Solanum subgen. Lycopersicon TaxID=49274 RepID=A0A3Q7FS85_SOLLC|nr:glutaredoxin [Solanum lycopersicum]XP_015067534.1 glutaredoxin [Solanum pennellii]